MKFPYSLIFLMMLYNNLALSQRYTITSIVHDFCASSFPTAYTTGSFSICSNENGVFDKNTTNRTLILALSGNYEFNTAAGSVSVTGNYLSIDTWSFTNNKTISIQYDAANTNATDCINFNNFQIRATGTGAGYIYRSGGTAAIAPVAGNPATPSTSNPTATDYFATLNTYQPGVYNTTSTTQASTADVNQYTINNQILRVNVNLTTGGCDANVSEFTFNTSGDAGTDIPATNIENAKLYYTGSSSTFATTTSYGSVANPNGAFTITGAQTLATGDNYFWLTYDVPGSANTDGVTPLNRLDASLTSLVFEGLTKSGTDFTSTNPAGNRAIIPATAYWSLSDGNWNDNARWSTTASGGAGCTCQPNGSGIVYLEHNVTLNANRTVDVIEIATTKTLNGASALIVNSALKTFGTGKFTLAGGLLTVEGNLTLDGTGASTSTRAITVGGDLTIGTGKSLTVNSENGNNQNGT